MIPLLYVKIVLNAVFISFKNQREQYKGQNIINLANSIFLAPLLIVLSLLMDIISLPDQLLQDEQNFETKY